MVFPVRVLTKICIVLLTVEVVGGMERVEEAERVEVSTKSDLASEERWGGGAFAC